MGKGGDRQPQFRDKVLLGVQYISRCCSCCSSGKISCCSSSSSSRLLPGAAVNRCSRSAAASLAAAAAAAGCEKDSFAAMNSESVDAGILAVAEVLYKLEHYLFYWLLLLLLLLGIHLEAG